MNFYSIRHLTRYRYSHPVSESIMETRMHPRSDAQQHCLTFTLSVSPRCRVFAYRDHLGNHVHHFDIPGEHSHLVIVAESVVEAQNMAEPPEALGGEAWDALDEMAREGDYWEMLLPSTFAVATPALMGLAEKLDARRRDDPLTVVRQVNHRLFEYFDYVPRHTRVDSPIDEAIMSGKGVCQDFAHTMIAMLRHVGIPSRYVSGYLYRGREDNDRSTPDATHAWVEALLPGVGWMGFDPTNDLAAGRRHIRTSIGRDYADVPPTHGVFRGETESDLFVAVHVMAAEEPPELDRKLPIPEDWSVLVEKAQQPAVKTLTAIETQQMQQQQQQ
ncbi:MAG TPA: transglutaminase family protein [Terracidiphilus sp.]|jgi:transglutaminase-like putative cysteine protease|nr:transglutaminase family protein [Terracidiphilus sp.]